jgi:ABC-type dipeptide/oligopeptide/nickel transport system permease subunit
MIILRHILPTRLAPLTVQATYICASAMITEAILSFIGAARRRSFLPGGTSWRRAGRSGR